MYTEIRTVPDNGLDAPSGYFGFFLADDVPVQSSDTGGDCRLYFPHASDINGVYMLSSIVKSISITESECVVHLTVIRNDSIDGNKYITIDFNKLVKSSATNKENKIYISGDPGAFIASDSVGRPPSVDSKLGIEVGGGDSTTARVVNALQYFMNNFCPGKRSAF